MRLNDEMNFPGQSSLHQLLAKRFDDRFDQNIDVETVFAAANRRKGDRSEIVREKILNEIVN